MRFWLIFIMMFSFLNSTFSLQHNSLSASETKVKKLKAGSGGIYTLAVDSQGSVYAGSENGVYKSLAYGKGPFVEKQGIIGGSVWSLAVDSKKNVYAASDNGVYKSNGTESFKPNLLGTIGGIHCLAVDSQDNVYAGSINGTVYKSNGTDPFIPMSSISTGINRLAVDSKKNVYVGSENGIVYKSNDRGRFLPMPTISGNVWSLAVDSKDNVYVGSENGIVYKSNGKESFKPISTGRISGIDCLAVDSKDDVYAGNNDGIVYKSNGKGRFIEMSKTSRIIYSLAVDSKDDVYAGSINGTVYKIYEVKKQKINLNGLTDNVTITNVIKGNLDSFKEKLIEKLQVDQFTNLSLSDVDVTKLDGSQLVANDIVTNANLAVKLTARSSSADFTGFQNINVDLTIIDNRINLSDLNNSIAINGVHEKDISTFKSAMLTKLKATSDSKFTKLSLNDIDITKSDGAQLIANDIVTNRNLAVKLTAKSDSADFAGFKDINVDLTTIDNRINLSDLNNNIAINGVHEKDISTFKSAMLAKLKTTSDSKFNNLSLLDIDITKFDGAQLVANDIVTNRNLAVKITAKSDSHDFIGYKDINVDLITIDNRINLSDLNNSIAINGVHEKDISTFKSAMLAKLKATSDSKFNNLSLLDIDITKSDGSQLVANDIVTNRNLAVKITAKSSSANFIGYKDINVNLTTIDSRTDLNNLVNPNPINNITKGDSNTFLITLIQELSQQTNFTNLLLEDVDITKGDGSQLTSSDIIDNSNLVVKIAAKANNAKFINSKTLTVNLTTKDYKFMAVAVDNDGTLWVAKNYNNKTILFKSNDSTNNNLYKVKEFNNLNTNVLGVNNNGIVYIGTTDGLYEGNSSNTNFTKIDNISDSVTALTTSSDGTIWVGTKITSTTGKVYHGTNNSFSEISGTTGAINTITIHDNDVWVGTTNGPNSGGLYKSINNNAFSQMLTRMTESVQSLAIDKDGTVWIGTKTGFGTGSLYQIQVDNTLNKISRIVNTVSALAIENDGTLLIGTQTGFWTGELYKLEKDKNLNAVTITTGAINSLTADFKNKKIWIGTTTGFETGALYQVSELDASQAKSSNILLTIGIITSIFFLLLNFLLVIIYLVKNKK